ncbi:MAG: class I SAM-dependent methyltransferase [Saprospiraceae bacterium]|jgi:ubiquinone/menaquinone biosynthesis C-methylase UbiE|nr:class I SAM-dependent methyltransferase [Saprospiraceae bacterium]
MEIERAMKNEEFWDELCGSKSFKKLGLNEINVDSIKIFDDWYFEYYPYLLGKYIELTELNDKDVLEIGLGFGTVGGQLSQYSKSYTGVDYAQGPVSMMSQRISWNQNESKAKALKGDARALPFKDNTFDYVVSIGCLHHTGDTGKSIDEVYRVLKPDGKALIMLYYKYSYKPFIAPLYYLKSVLIGPKRNVKNYTELVRSIYDSNSSGDGAPITSLTSKSEAKEMFKKFSSVKMQLENNDVPFVRQFLLKNISKIIGLDLYFVATK